MLEEKLCAIIPLDTRAVTLCYKNSGRASRRISGRLFQRYDALLTPTTPVAPFPVEKNYPEVVEGRRMQHYIDWIGPTFLVSLAAGVPAGLTAARLPVGLQIIGPSSRQRRPHRQPPWRSSRPP